ncbi:MAG: S-layer homology domain-containing protein [Acidaminococcaceae bacterium]
MKKSLVLAMAMALGVSATAFAANPFSDVPAGHWAYASVSKLAAAGIVDGYPDGTFKGDNLMTRYEMAQIVAKAYAKGAIGADDKLMAEFADELDNLGVRVAKLEKKADNVKITGEFRVGYKDYDKGLVTRQASGTSKIDSYRAEARTRLFLAGAINDDWTYGAMIENTQDLDDNAENADTKFRRAFVTGNLGSGVKLTAGRQAFKIGSGYVFDATGIDAVKVDFGKVLKGTAFYGRSAGDDTYSSSKADKSDIWALGLSYDFDKNLYMNAAYYGIADDGSATAVDRDIYTVGLGYKFDKNTSLYGEYLKSSEKIDGEDDGYAATLTYKGAKAAKANTWGAYVSYYDQPAATIIDHTSEFYGDMASYFDYGIKGYEVGTNYTLAKNVVANVSYYDYEANNDSSVDNSMLWSRLVFTF